ncbi:MAG: hypothetical protein ABI807_03610, partial [Sporichthyaceae bacterium]
MLPNPRRVLALAGMALATTLVPLAGTAAPAAAAGTPSAMSVVRGMADGGVRLTQRRAEGPDAVVAD